MINYLVLINVATELPMMLVAMFDMVGCLCVNPFRCCDAPYTSNDNKEDVTAASAAPEKQTSACVSAPNRPVHALVV